MPAITMKNVGGLVRDPADRFQVALAIIGPFILIGPFFLSLNIGFEIGLWVVVWLCVCRHNYILHNHVHRPFSRSRILNRTIAVLLGFCTGMTAGNWKIAHVHGHHVEDKLDLLSGRDFVRYFKIDENGSASNFSALRHALRTAPLQWIIPVAIMIRQSFRKYHFRRKFYRFYLLEFLFVYSLVLCMFLFDPLKAFFYFGIIYSLVYVVGRHVDYVTHVSGDNDARLGFANVCLHPKYNRLLWNFGFHIAHHLQPRAHWTELPNIYHELKAEEHPASVAETVNCFGWFSPATFHWHRVKDPGGAR